MNRETVSKIKVVLVGAGALGNQVFTTLGLLGVGQVLVVDPDTIEPSNLSRSIFFRETERLTKAEALCDAGTRLFPDTKWKCVTAEIADVGYADLQEYQLVLGCVDSDLARLEMSYVSIRLGIPYVDGGLGTHDYWRSRVSIFPVGGPCFGCKLTPARRRNLLQSLKATNRSCWADTPTAAAPSTPVMAAITGALQVDIGLRHVISTAEAGRSDISETTELTLGNTSELKRCLMLQSVGCPFHDPSDAILQPAHDGCRNVEELLQLYNANRVELDWPLCVGARCQVCGTGWRPMKRTGWFRKYAVCPSCSSRQVIELINLRHIERDSEWAFTPIAALGLPPRHLYSLT